MNTAATPTPTTMRSFLTIWIGEVISMIGSSLTAFGLSVYMFVKTGDATPFALTMLFFQLPTVLLAPLGGVVADRFNRRLVMLVADSFSAVGTLVALWLVSTDQLAVWHVYALAVVYAASNAFQEPAYMASITMLVPKEQYGKANGMMQAAQALTALVGPLVAGALYAPIGLRGLMTIDFVTFFAAVGALAIVRIPRPVPAAPEEGKKPTLISDLLYGWRYIGARAGMLGLLLYFSAVNFLANLAMVLNGPLVLSFTTPAVYGIIQMVGGIGMLVGSIAMGAWGGPKRKMNGVYGFITLSMLGLFLIGARANAWLIGAGFAVLMGFVPLASGSAMALWQAKVDPASQGRVFSARVTVSRGLMPLAMLIAGPLADQVFEPFMAGGSPLASTFATIVGAGPGRGIALIFFAAGALLLAASVAAYLNPHVRNIEDELPDFTPAAAPEEAAEASTAQPAAGTA